MDSIDDIVIGPGKSIPWIHIDENEKNVFDIDGLLVSTWTYWAKLETECLHECCGINAFNFLPQNISQATENIDLPDLINKITLLRNELENSSNTIFISGKFNNLFAKEMFINLIDHNLVTLSNLIK